MSAAQVAAADVSGAALLWLPCDGSVLSAEEFPELFAAIGHTFGGDGDEFITPNLSCAPVQANAGLVRLAPMILARSNNSLLQPGLIVLRV